MLDTRQKLDILSGDSQYDLACACGTDDRSRRHRSADGRSWLYPVPLARGGYGIMLKTLISNACASDCKYCPLRADGTAAVRCTLVPDELAREFMNILRRRWLLGIFLSSGVVGTPDRTMQLLTDTAAILRYKYHYKGYIHLKIIPGASDAAVRYALSLATAVSLNIEAPGERRFAALSSFKNYQRDIIAPLKLMAAETGRGAPYAKVKCTTQFIVGAADETDAEIVRYMGAIYQRLNFERVYFSAYQTGLGRPELPGERNFKLAPEDRLTREHRLYQTDFLLRRYQFSPDEIPFDDRGNLLLDCDPKEFWARRHPEFFPVRVNTAEQSDLLRVPGLGPVAVDRLLSVRREYRVRALSDVGLRGKLASKATPYLDFS